MTKPKNIERSKKIKKKRMIVEPVDIGLGTIEPISIKNPDPITPIEPLPVIPPIEDKTPDKKPVIPLKEPDRLDKLQRSISLALMSIGFLIIISGCIYRYTGFKWYIDMYAGEVMAWVISTQRR
jgi:hypothetical protein